MKPNSPFQVTTEAMRPASSARQCSYCRQAVGDFHKSDCVLVKKTVRIRMTVEYEVEVPAGWDKHAIEFHRNDGGWCANNALDELAKIGGDDGCICNIATFELVADSDVHFLGE